MHRRIRRLSIVFILLCGALGAEEGMWTFDNPPVDKLRQKYNFTPTAAWLDHIRLASVRLNDGGSGSFVSPHGLLLTNHHVARGQLQKNSTPAHDYVRDGFYAAAPEQEMKSPDLEVNVLMSTENVTARVEAALENAQTPEQQFSRRKAAIAQIERESDKATGFRSDVVTFYKGAEYWLYRYKKYTDVRLVFAPEAQIAFFGGDPDNFTYPRFDLDMALFRVYENGKPVDSKDYLKWNPNGAQAGDLVFVSGNPGWSQRLDTVAQLIFERDVRQPLLIRMLKNRLAILERYSSQGEEQRREAASKIFGLQNGIKLLEGRERGLRDAHVMERKKEEEQKFRSHVNSNPQLNKAYGNAWAELEQAEQKARTRIKEEFFRRTNSDLASIAEKIVEYVVEVKKPDGERLPGFHEAELESLRFELFSPAPVYPAMEIAQMTGALETALHELGPEDPYLKIVLSGKTPRQAATDWISPTKLADPLVRRRLIDGGEAAVSASDDCMIMLARRLDPVRRELIKWSEDNVESIEQRAGEKLGRASFAVYGKTTYPDATFTLRLSYGKVAGYPMNGTIAPPKTTFYGLYDRANSFNLEGPFALPSRYLEGLGKLNLATPLDFVTTNDIIGGNSGSPVIDRDGRIVGLIFDGNIESLVGDFIYDETTNRAVAVTTNAMTEAVQKLYGAQRLVDELMQ
jgi:hypothetical protein